MLSPCPTRDHHLNKNVTTLKRSYHREAILTSASEAFDTQPVLNILAFTTLTDEEAVHKSRILTILSNLMFALGTSGIRLSLVTV